MRNGSRNSGPRSLAVQWFTGDSRTLVDQQEANRRQPCTVGEPGVLLLSLLWAAPSPVVFGPETLRRYWWWLRWGSQGGDPLHPPRT